MGKKRDGLALRTHGGERSHCLLLVRPEFKGLAVLLRQELVERKKSGNGFKEEFQLLLHAFGFGSKLAICPAKDVPPLVYEAVLPQ
jgi:hypothetical protein